MVGGGWVGGLLGGGRVGVGGGHHCLMLHRPQSAGREHAQRSNSSVRVAAALRPHKSATFATLVDLFRGFCAPWC